MGSTIENAATIAGEDDHRCHVVQQFYLDACFARQVKPNSVAQAVLNAPSPIFRIDFSGAHLGDRGVLPVLLALARVPTLAEVIFSNCALHMASVDALCDFVRFHGSLRRIDLRNNNFSSIAALAFVFALESRQRVVGSAKQSPAVVVQLANTGLVSNCQPAPPPSSYSWPEQLPA